LSLYVIVVTITCLDTLVADGATAFVNPMQESISKDLGSRQLILVTPHVTENKNDDDCSFSITYFSM